MKKVEYVYKIFCISGAIGMTAFCFYRYSKNESRVSVNEKAFHDTPRDVYPSMTICLTAGKYGLFVDKNNVSRRDIVKMMTGFTEINQSVFENTNYDEMTMTLKVKRFRYRYLKGKFDEDIPCQKSKCMKIRGDSVGKCITHDIQFKKQVKYKEFNIHITKTTSLMEADKMKIFFHHPGQLFRNGLDPVLSGPYHMMANNIKLNIQRLSVIEKRESGNTKCNMKIFDDDKILLENAAKKFNCTSKYPGEFS